MHRSAPRLSRILACAAVPVMLVVAGCSSDSGDSKDSGSSTAPSAKKTEPTVEPAKFATLPDACSSIARKTIEDLVPKAKSKGGTPGKSSDTATRGGCSWNGLDDNGVKGSQYRWLDVGFTRFDSDQSLGSGAKRATDEYTKQVSKAQATEGAKDAAAKPASGIGEQATSVTYSLTKSKEDFEYATVIARTGNVVVSVTYNGAGFAGAKTPSAADILKDAQKAAKEAASAVGADDAKSSASPSAKASSSAKSSASAMPSSSAKAASKTTAKAKATAKS
ncbi:MULTISPECIES: DUF3558 domain-containing protein [unclassified Streptomyces]|uniref:DUF3558 domain-containing protein n=1 Tax=unclassified Streptomyces TaxID=2593676 RepID=UPI00093C9A53|nr:DUF3558 domain-containing protein [Streptomyces sp. CB02058]OKI87502.1 hypothetical protein AMK10_34480 [Streptomyces sp. CB02058]